MKPLYRRRSSFGLNLTPLIDVVFLLLVFFMLTAHFVEDESIVIDLPEARSGEGVEELKVVEVAIDAAGAIRIDGAEVPDEALEGRLRAALALRSDKRVRVRGDEKTPLGRSVRVMDAARLAGASALDIITERP